MKKVFFLLVSILILNTSLHAEIPTKDSVTQLYVATFNRAPDTGGLDYWLNDSGLQLEGIASSFFDQPETQTKYPANSTNEEFVIAVYNNLFNREPEQAGLDYWVAELDSGRIGKSVFILAVINGAQNTVLGNDATILDNKTIVGLAYADAGLDDVDDATEIMSGITDDYATVIAALETFSLNIPPLAQCAGDPPAEGSVAGLYRSYSYLTPNSVTSVAISLRGWRTVAGTDGGGLFLFSRSQADPIVHTLVNSTIKHVDMSRDGSVVAASDGDGKIYLYECDASQPSWSYATEPDDNDLFPEVEVAVSDDGRWLAATSDYHFYLFRRDNAVPVLKLKLSDTERLSTLAMSGDGSRLAVATEFAFAVNGKRAATLFLFNRDGLLWQTQILSEECSANVSFLPLALSRDGTKLAAGGCDNQIRFWDTASASSTWTAQIGDGEEITGVAMAADGNSLAINGETIHYVRDTAAQPDFSSADNWAFNYWLTYKQPSVYGVLDSFDGLEWDGLSGRAPQSGPGNMSISDNGHYIFAGSTAVSYLLHRDDNEVTRLFGTLEDSAQYFHASAISPHASWVTTGSIFGGNEILRFEVAPVQKISADLPLTVTYPSDPTGILDFFGLFEVDSYTISYTVLKPGRAADINQHWSLWGFDGTVFVSPATDLFCSGDAEWNWTLNLADGDIESTGSREIEPPHCLASSISSVGTFDLFADTEPINPEQGGVSNLYTDSTLLMNIQVSSGP